MVASFSYQSLPDLPGVYIFKDKKGNPLYVGKAKNLKIRVGSYFKNREALGEKTRRLVESVWDVDLIIVQSELEALLLEANLIKKHVPPFNVRWTDGKAYPFIKITVKDTYPKVLQTRHVDDPKALYFGPYPNIGDVRRILKPLRKIFPYVSARNHPKRICLYNHLGLCPCPQAFDSKETLNAYKKNIRYVIQFLDGRKKIILNNLLKEMRQASNKEDFEKASFLKRQIDTILLITRPVRTTGEYLRNPNLVADDAVLDILRLANLLKENDIKVSELLRIECYDISNISGRQGSGSMVVAKDGILDKSQYRHFRIRFKNTPNDLSMLSEVVSRRIKHNEWNIPNLIVIDGGITQVNAVIKVLRDAHLKIPVVGLAKRQEEIYFGRNKKLRLQRDDRALRLLQRLRDEAHRFALSYHKKLRKSYLFNSLLL